MSSIIDIAYINTIPILLALCALLVLVVPALNQVAVKAADSVRLRPNDEVDIQTVKKTVNMACFAVIIAMLLLMSITAVSIIITTG